MNIKDRLDKKYYIKSNYDNDLNIIEIHSKIIKKFEEEKNTLIPEYKRQIEQLENATKIPQNMIDRKICLSKIEKIKNKIKDLENDKLKMEYLENTCSYLEEYDNMGVFQRSVDISGDNIIIETKDIEIRRSLISTYLLLAKKYIDIDIIYTGNSESRCVCGENTSDFELDDNGDLICPSCASVMSVYQHSLFTGGKPIINTTKNNYKDRANFEKALKYYQGKYLNKIDKLSYEKLIVSLDKYFTELKFPKGSEIKCSKNNENGRKEETSVLLMLNALKSTNNSQYYKIVMYICHDYWGWETIDLTNLEESIMNDYDLTQNEYENIPKTRSSSLNTQFRLYKHLCRYRDKIKYKIIKEDFRYPITHNILRFHENIWTTICENLTKKGYDGWINDSKLI